MLVGNYYNNFTRPLAALCWVCWAAKRRRSITRITAHVEGHYEATRTPWATDYVWVPGEREVEGRLLNGILRPWHAAYAEQVKEQRAHPEEQYRREMEAL